MSPRRTQALHEVGHGEHLGPVDFVGFERRHLGSQRLSVLAARRSLNQCRPDGLRTSQASCFELPQGP